MTIVLNETEWAEEMIRARSLGKKPSETLLRVARYYLDKNCTKQVTRRMLELFLSQCDPMVSLPKWSSLLDYTVKRAIRTPATVIDGIDISAHEMAVIDALDSNHIGRLAFTLLCLAKYWDIVNGCSDHWVNSKDSDIMKMANIKDSIRVQSAQYGKLKELGLIRFPKQVDNTNVQVCFVQHGDPVLRVTDFRNLGYQYLLFHGNPNYFRCQNCGGVFRKNTTVDRPYLVQTGRPQKYCPCCVTQIKTKQSVDSVMRSRPIHNQANSNL